MAGSKQVYTASDQVTQANGLTKYYALCGDFFNPSTTEADKQGKFRSGGGTFSKLSAYALTNTLDGTTTIRLRVNAGNVSEVISITGGATGAFSDSSNTDAISANDLVNHQIVTAGNSGSIVITFISTTFVPATNFRYYENCYNLSS